MRNPNSRTAASARAFGLCLALAFTLSCAAPGDEPVDARAAPDAIQQKIAQYTAAVDAADIELASQVWLTSPDISFINPAGHAHGWEEVQEIYKFFAASFSERKLTAHDVAVHVHGDSAWAEFYWQFDATQSKDGAAVQNKGRETQIYNWVEGRWQLVHVHYSGPAMTF